MYNIHTCFHTHNIYTLLPPGFTAARDGAKLRAELSHNLTRATAWEAVMRVRCSRGLKISSFHGHFFNRYVCSPMWVCPITCVTVPVPVYASCYVLLCVLLCLYLCMHPIMCVLLCLYTCMLPFGLVFISVLSIPSCSKYVCVVNKVFLMYIVVMLTHTHTHTHTHTRTHTHTHTHTHTNTPPLSATFLI